MHERWWKAIQSSKLILQSFLNEFLNLPEPCVEPAAVSREEFFADRVEFPLELPQLLEQRG